MNNTSDPESNDQAGIDHMGKNLLSLQNIRGTYGCFLNNTFCPPYKKPRLPFGGNSSKVHRLLRPLKIAHALMVENARLVGGNPQEKLYFFRLVYTIDLEHPDIPHVQMRQRWFSSGDPKPFFVAGFALFDSCTLFRPRFSFNLSPLSPGSEKYINAVQSIGARLDPLRSAVSFYNEYVRRLYETGYLIMPIWFDAVGVYFDGVEHLPKRAVVLDI